MAQKVTPDKDRKEKEQIKKKESRSLIQVDKQGDPISNFIANFKRQFREAKGLLNWGKLFGSKRTEPPTTYRTRKRDRCIKNGYAFGSQK